MKTDYRVFIPLAFTCLLLSARMIITGELTYVFLVWNLFLASVPYLLSIRLEKKKRSWKIWLYVGCWVLFLPNAPYIITDFFHLRHRPPVPYWFDVILLFSAALNGFMLGLISLWKVEKFISSHYGKKVAGLLIFSSMFLSGFGIYIGRWLRWNSWDVLVSPKGITHDIMTRVLNPFDHFFTWSVTIIFSLFIYTFYYTMKGFIQYTTNQLN